MFFGSSTLGLLIIITAGFLVGCADTQSGRQVSQNAEELGHEFENSSGKVLEWTGDKIDRGVNALDKTWIPSEQAKDDAEREKNKERSE